MICLGLTLAGCQGKTEKTPGNEQAAKPAASAKPDDGSIPKNLEIPYQVLFQCRIETAQKEGRTYSPNPETSRDVRDTVAKNPAAGDECMAKLRGGSAGSGKPAGSAPEKAPTDTSGKAK